MSVTEIVCGLLLAFGSETVIVAVYVPVDKPETFTDAVTEAWLPLERAPDVGFKLSHVASLDTVQFNVEPPVFVIVNVSSEGLVSSIVEKLREVLEREIAASVICVGVCLSVVSLKPN